MTVRANCRWELFERDDDLRVKWKRDRNEVEKGQAPEKKQTNKHKKHKSQKEGRKKGKCGRKVNGWSNYELCDGESSDLIFSMVSSGMGATVCTAGRFLLVAPLTNDEEEEEDEEAESVAPRRDRETGNGGVLKKQLTWIKHDQDNVQDNITGNELMLLISCN